MNRGKYAAPRRRRRRSTLKPLLVAMAVVLLIGCFAGGTLAWLTSTPDAVTNTFTTSDITITLTETGTVDNAASFKMIPGYIIDKDPKVTVKGGSEKCWVFVKIDESTDPVLRNYITYDVEAGWSVLDQDKYPGVYYRIVDANAADQTFNVIGHYETVNGVKTFIPNKILVNSSVTKEMMNALNQTGAAKPTLTFKAYAIQYYKSNGVEFPVADAYDQVKTLDTTTTPPDAALG